MSKIEIFFFGLALRFVIAIHILMWIFVLHGLQLKEYNLVHIFILANIERRGRYWIRWSFLVLDCYQGDGVRSAYIM